MSAKPQSEAPPMEIERTGTAAEPVVRIVGEIDVATAPVVRDELASAFAAGARTLTLDLGGVAFVDSSGLGVLVGALRRLREDRDGRVVICNAQAGVRKVFEITGLGPMFGLAPR
jgi:anti-sigma B factor antagonist